MKQNDDIKNLNKKIEKFKKWALKNHPECDEAHDNGEWEYDPYSYFDEMRDAAIVVISCNDIRCADDELVDNLLYAIARDNESEIIADELIKYPEWFQLLMVLTVLQRIGSSKLKEYIERAMKFDYKYLTEWAEEFRKS